MKHASVLLLLLLAGCSTAAALPSVKYCDEVQYVRRGDTFEVSAKDCRIPSRLGLPKR